MVKINVNEVNQTAYQIETSMVGTQSQILAELAAATTGLLNEVTYMLPEERKKRAVQDFITTVYMHTVEGEYFKTIKEECDEF